uniref:Uncharacterized protein n=1 Tax=Arundo donax TaxID=35708 RepID=A0A0A9CR05_ARUDO
MSSAVAAAASSPRRRAFRAAAATLRILFRLCTDAVLYGFLATLWAGCFGGLLLMVFGTRLSGEGSKVQAFGGALLLRAFGILQQLLPAFIPLLVVRIVQRVCDNETPLVPNGVKLSVFSEGKLPPYAAILPSYVFLQRAIRSQLDLEKGSLGWRVGFAFCDVAALGFCLIASFLVVRDMAILVTIPRAKHRVTVMR